MAAEEGAVGEEVFSFQLAVGRRDCRGELGLFLEGEEGVAHGAGAVGEEEAGEGEGEDAFAEGAVDDEANVSGVGEEAGEDAAGDDPPGAFDLGGDVGGFGDGEAGGGGEVLVFLKGAHAGEAAFFADFLEEVGFEAAGVVGGGPDGEGGMGTGFEGAVELLEEEGLVFHVGEGLDGDGGVEGVVGEGGSEPVLDEVVDVAVGGGRLGAGLGGLLFGEGEGGDVEAVGFGEPTGRGAVAAADVGEVVAGFEGEGRGDALEEVEGGVVDAAFVVVVVPEAVVDVVAPGVSVEVVELVVVTGDVGGGEGDPGGDHGIWV